MKTKVMIYNQKYEVVREFDDFTFKGQSIDQVGSYKYLGVILLQSLGTVRCGHAPFILFLLLPIYRAKLPNSKRIVLVPKCYV